MLSRLQAHIAAGYGYKLVDKEGYEYKIISTLSTFFVAQKEGSFGIFVYFDKIGTDYFILARDLSQLTEEIEHDGERFVPYEKLKNLDDEYYIVEEEGELFFDDKCALGIYEVTRCESLIAKLYEWHFSKGFPPQCVKPLK